MSVSICSYGYGKTWFEDLFDKADEYQEPFLDEYACGFMKFACKSLKQDTHVFLASVDILESYARKKSKLGQKIVDPALAMSCSILLGSKNVGAQSDLRPRTIGSFLSIVNRNGNSYSSAQIKSMEMDIYKTLDRELPLHSKVDDLNTFLEMYLQPKFLKADLRTVCVKLLELVCICRQSVFGKLLIVYRQNDEAYLTFRSLICNKLYFPTGILLCALKCTNYKNVLNISKIAKDLAYLIGVHIDHLEYLCDCICDLLYFD